MSRTTAEIIQAIHDFVPFDDGDTEHDNESYFYDITDALTANGDGFKAIVPIFSLMEKYPEADFGSPGPLVHFLEIYRGVYEDELYVSLKRQPAMLTVWMLNRIINAEKDYLHKALLIVLMDDIAKNNLLSEVIRNSAKAFLEYQTTDK